MDTAESECDPPQEDGTTNAVKRKDAAPTEDEAQKKNVFKINRDKIMTLPGAQSQAGELQNLGVDVISQEDFEKGVLDQVDQAITQQEQKEAKDRAQRDLDSIQTDIRLATRDLKKIEKYLETMKKQGIQRNISTVQVQKQDKEKELENLNKKKKSLMNRLEGKPDKESDEEDDSNDQEGGGAVLHHLLTKPPVTTTPEETEQERLIRLGEMTPFEMAAQSVNKEGAPSDIDTQSDFAQFLGAKDVMTVKKHVEKSKWKGSSLQLEEGGKKVVTIAGSGWQSWEESEEQKRKLKEDKFKKKRKTPKMKFEPKYDPTKEKAWKKVKPSNKKARKALRKNWGSDSEISGGEGKEEDGSRRVDDSEGSNFSDEMPEVGATSEDEIILQQQNKKGKKKSRSEQIEDGDITCLDDLKATYVKPKREPLDKVIKCQDDSSQDLYFKRLRANRRKEENAKAAKESEKKGSDETGSESDSDVDDIELKGGLVIPGEIWNKLYRYQMTGVRWMWELHQQRAGGIMGDEMGLGKTIQMIAFLAGLKNSHLRDKEFRYEGLGPVIIICPATVMHQWVKEFHKWYPEMRVAILHTSGSHIGTKATLVRDIVNTHSVLITSYTTCRIQQELIQKFDWHYVILDEGHKIRNPEAEVTIACKQFCTPHRLILTGSPLQNNLQELWSLFDFVFPGKLGTLPVFMEQFSVPITQGGYANATSVQVQTAYKCACVLRDTINPYLLRRMKVDVQQNVQLPSKNEQVLFCRLTDEQKEIYRDYLTSRECHQILKGEYQIFSGLITMRKICNHPHLVSGGPQILKGDSEESVPVEERYGHWSKAGKMLVIDSLLKIWKKQGHRVLLFTQGRQMLDILESYVRTRYTYMRLDGGTGIASRQTLINRFNQNPAIFIFILTTRVGGLGVNLTGANRVIIYDPDWNPSTDAQARERAWRIGQKRDVTIYRLLTAGTIEEKIYHRQIYKHFLTNRVLKDPRQRRFFKSNDLFELFTLNDGTEETETSAIFAGTGSNIKADSEPDTTQSPRRPKKLKRSKTADSLETGQRRTQKLQSKSRESPSLAEEPVDGRSTSVGYRQLVPDESMSSMVDRKDSKTEHAPHKRSASLDAADVAMDTSEVEFKKYSIPKKVARTEEENEDSSGGKVFDFKSLNSYGAGDGEEEWQPVEQEGDVDRPGVTELIEESLTRRTGARPDEDKRTKDKRKGNNRDAKRKKKKRKKDAKLDGVRIANLAKHKVFKSAKELEEEGEADEEDKEAHQKQDKFVLDKLFKKSGVHSALKHDNIMEASNPDYVLIENEASRVAKEAARALKVSRQRCPTARSGVPTWTGNIGQGGPGMAKPRFGQKVNSIVAGQTTDQNGSPANKKIEEKGFLGNKKLFNGASAAAVETSALEEGPALPSSSSLLAKMRARNQVQMTEPEEEVGTTSRMTPLVSKKYQELMAEVQTFITEKARIPGQASTAEILKSFQKKLSKEDTPVFRSMLRQICKFERSKDGKGTWRLKIDYL